MSISNNQTNYLTPIIVCNVVFGLAFLVSLLLAMISPMLFDAPGSENKWNLWALFFIIISYPLVYIICLVLSIILYKKGRSKEALIASIVPGVHCLLLFVALLFIGL